MKVVRYFKNNKLVEEKVGYSDEEPLTTKKIHYVDLPDGSRMVRETCYNVEGGNILNVTDFKYNLNGVLISKRTTYPDMSFYEYKYNEEGNLVRSLSISDNKLCNLETCEYDEYGNIVSNIHYIIDDNGDICYKDICLHKNIYRTGEITESSIVIRDDTSIDVNTVISTFDNNGRCIEKASVDVGVVEYFHYYKGGYTNSVYINEILTSKTTRTMCNNTSEESSWCFDVTGNTVSSTNKIFKDNKIIIFEYFDGDKCTHREYEYDEHGNTTIVKENGSVKRRYINIYE